MFLAAVYVCALERIIAVASRMVVTGGVFAIATQNTGDFEGAGPVPNVVGSVIAAVNEHVGESFLGAPAVWPRRRRRSGPGDEFALVPELWHVVVHRRA